MKEKYWQKFPVCFQFQKKDAIKISKEIPNAPVSYLPVFLPFQEVDILQGSGDYCLYHGNLSIAENAKAVEWLANNLKNNSVKLIIAGKSPSDSLKNFLKKKNIALIDDPSDEEMFQLIQNAHINIILSFNDTGIKLKLLNTLFHGRHCVVNEAAIPGSGFESFCSNFSSAQEFNQIISDLMKKSFDKLEIEKRKEFLLTQFNNEANAEKLNELL